MTGATHSLYETHVDLIGAAVIVKLHSLAFIRGALFSIDPENGNVILFQFEPTDAAEVCTQGVMAHTITSIEKDDEGMDLQAIQESIERTHAPSNVERTPVEVQSFLQEHCIDSSIEESNGQLVVFGGAATIASPYDEFSVCAKNDLVLERLTNLLRMMKQ
ncbi:hypothetical protein LEN26_001050 [Aphanomyces euteiches]|nr:hypothetical protein AeMF1_001011 [Aphanomyces euteiches]KAH9162206.1 hypothetical protein LEN26_001050 [Aphanomyces euteiches]KAH9196334.1 hypothetical protein AeNC1_001688 [Aphanomyces euteiches]